MIQVCKKRSKVAEIIVSCVCGGGWGGILYIVEITDMSQFSQQPSKSCLEIIRAVAWTLSTTSIRGHHLSKWVFLVLKF